MEITNDPLEFTSDDVINWRNFLRTTTGSRLIPKLLELVPALLSEGDTNKVLIRNGERLGYENAAKNLLALAFPPPEVKLSSNYPDLVDDKQWNDGQEIKTT